MPNMIRWSMVAALAFALVTGTLRQHARPLPPARKRRPNRAPI